MKTYTDAAQLLADPDVDVVDITLPTYLHAEYAIRALQAGKHVICEKPMALCSADAKKMAATAKKAHRRLFVAQCIRFWPAYATAREVIRSRKYGRVRSAVFTRLSATPTWSWNQWLHNPRRAARRRSICTSTIRITFSTHSANRNRCSAAAADLRKRGSRHIVTSYDYGGTSLIVAEGAWEYAPTFQFSMTFRVAMDKATLELAADGNLRLHSGMVRVPWFQWPRETATRTSCGISSIASPIAEPRRSCRPTPPCRAYG